MPNPEKLKLPGGPRNLLKLQQSYNLCLQDFPRETVHQTLGRLMVRSWQSKYTRQDYCNPDSFSSFSSMVNSLETQLTWEWVHRRLCRQGSCYFNVDCLLGKEYLCLCNYGDKVCAGQNERAHQSLNWRNRRKRYKKKSANITLCVLVYECIWTWAFWLTIWVFSCWTDRNSLAKGLIRAIKLNFSDLNYLQKDVFFPLICYSLNTVLYMREKLWL